MARVVGPRRLRPRRERSDHATPTLDELLAPARWRRDTRNGELRKALGYMRAALAEVRRLVAQPKDALSLWTPEAESRLRDVLNVPVDSLTIDSAWELYNAIKATLPLLGNAEYVAAQLDHEAERLKKPNRWQPWTEHFERRELKALRRNYQKPDPDPHLHAQAATKLAFLYARRAEFGRERRARIRRTTRSLVGATALLAATLFGAIFGVIGARPDLWKTVLVVLLIGLVASPVMVLPWLTRVRDQVRELDDLALFWPSARLALVASIAFPTGLAAAHVAADGLSEQSGGAELLSVGAFALCVTGFLVGWSGFWRRWIFWRKQGAEDIGTDAFASAVAVAALTEFFAIVTVALAAYGNVDYERAATPQLGSVEQYYAWHLADAIPALDVPETLNWARPLSFTDHLAGVLLLVFKLLAILPIAGVLAHLLQRYTSHGEHKTGSTE